LFARNFARED